jgi:glycosyltransferase involved in cell wall biosynthesis
MSIKFTLVTTVFNEAKRLDDTIADIEAQTWKPDEVIVIDAGSTDGTMERLFRWGKESSISVRAEVMPKCNIAQGRNYAISIARNELIASTDFGCRYKPMWLENLMKPFTLDSNLEVTAGNFTVNEEEIHSLPAKSDYVLQNGYQYNENWPYLPSSRSIGYYRRVWEKVGKYPEWVTLAADDSTYWYVLEKIGFNTHCHWERDVYWMRHNSFKGFAKEAFRYGLGEGETKSGIRNFTSNLIEAACRYTLPVTLLLMVIMAVLGWSWYYLLPIMVFQTFGLRSYNRAIGQWNKFKGNPKYHTLEVLFACFRQIEISRINHTKGFIKGYWKSPASIQAEGLKLQAFLKS